MQDVILLVSTSAIFIFGYFLMRKLDVFLENNRNRQETALTYGENSLRIGFSNPFMAGGLADAFETYGKQHPDVSTARNTAITRPHWMKHHSSKRSSQP